MIKRNFYLLALLLLVLGASSCKKDDEPAPLPAVVGKWELDHVILSDFPTFVNASGETVNYNGRWNPQTYEFLDLTSKLYIINEGKAFLESTGYNLGSWDLEGTWTFNNTTLTLTTPGATSSTEVLTYSVVKGVEQLSGTPSNFQMPGASTTPVNGKIQFVYRK